MHTLEDEKRIIELLLKENGAKYLVLALRGCPYSVAAVNSIHNVETNPTDATIVWVERELKDSVKQALRSHIDEYNNTFPAVFIEGIYVGGNQELQQILQSQLNQNQ